MSDSNMAAEHVTTPPDDLEGYQPLRVNIISGKAPNRWLAKGWADFKRRPFFGIGYGLFFVLISYLTIAVLIWTELEWMLGPALAGAMLVGPILATGLYRESRRQAALAKGEAMPEYNRLNFSQVALIGAVLMTMLLIWIRAAVIIYALFFGLTPFPGLWETITVLFLTPTGLTMLAVGSAVGGLFAAFVFAISAFSIPMLVDKDVDAFTAMGSSFVAVTRNFWPMVKWGAIISLLFGLGLATGLIGMILIFPILGHATWHAYDEVFHNVSP